MRMSPPARLSRLFLDLPDPAEGAGEDEEGTYRGRRGSASECIGEKRLRIVVQPTATFSMHFFLPSYE